MKMPDEGTAPDGTGTEEKPANQDPEIDKAIARRDKALADRRAAEAARDEAHTQLAEMQEKLQGLESTQEEAERNKGEWAKVDERNQGKIKTLGEQLAEATKLNQQLTSAVRERAMLDGLADAFSGATRSRIKGAYLVAVDEGKLERSPEDPDKSLKAAIKILGEVDPGLAAQGSGEGGTSSTPRHTGANNKPDSLGDQLRENLTKAGLGKWAGARK
jgi:chromosome segregation ATPase